MPKRPSRSRSTFLAAALLSSCVVAGAALGAELRDGATIDSAAEGDGQADLYAVVLERKVIADAIPAFPERDRLLLPVGELCRIFEIEAAADGETGGLKGKLPSGEKFAVDGRGLRVTTGERKISVDPELLRTADGDVYLDSALVSLFLPVDFTVNRNALTITATARSILPLQERLAREKRAELLERAGNGAPAYPALRVPYRLFGGPFVDQTLQFRLDPPSSQDASRVALDYSTHLAADLLWATLDGYMSGTTRGVQDLRLSLGRKDPDGRLGGPLRATEVGAGNIFDSGVELVMAPASGFGAAISSFPIQRTAFFDRTAFRGGLPAGWSVELFLNGDLIGYQSSRPDGLYEFLGVPVYFGFNVYRLVFYGPTGQRREETKTFSATETLTPAGQFRYRAGGMDPNVRLVSALPVETGSRAWIEGEYGLTKGLALAAAVARATPYNTDARNYATAGLRASLGAVFLRGDAAVSSDGGRALQFGAQARLGGMGFLAQYAEMSDYVTDWFRSIGSDLRRRAYFRFDGQLPAGKSLRLPLSLDVERAERIDGTSSLRMNGRLSGYVSGLSASNVLTWWRDDGLGATSDLVTGSLLVSRLSAALVVRGGLEYQLRPEALVRAGTASVEKRLKAGYLVTAQAQREFVNATTTVALGVTKSQGSYGFGTQVQYASPGGFRVSAQLTFSFGRDDVNRWNVSAEQMGGTGGLVGRSFFDSNGNGVFDVGELPLDQVQFQLNGSRSRAATDVRGEAFLRGLMAYQPAAMSVASETLADPYWKSTIEGVSIVPRPGRAPVVDFPVRPTGEVTGNVYVNSAGRSRAVGGIKVELVDGGGKVVQSAVSAWDGYFVLTGMFPGEYTIRVGAESLHRRGAKGAKARVAKIGNDGTILDGLDLFLDVDSIAESEPVGPVIREGSAAGGVGTGGNGWTPIAADSATRVRRTEEARGGSERLGANTVPGQGQGPEKTAEGSRPGTAAGSQPRAGSRPKELDGSRPRTNEAGIVETTVRWGVQVAAVRELAAAEAEVARLAARLGVGGEVQVADLQGKGLWYRVVLGAFSTVEEAGRFRTKIAAEIEGGVGPIRKVGGASDVSPKGVPAEKGPRAVMKGSQPSVQAAVVRGSRDAATSPTAPAGKMIGFQVSSGTDQSAAEELARRLEALLSVKTHVVPVDLDPKGTWYRVVVGEFESEADARAYWRKLGAAEKAGDLKVKGLDLGTFIPSE